VEAGAAGVTIHSPARKPPWTSAGADEDEKALEHGEKRLAKHGRHKPPSKPAWVCEAQSRQLQARGREHSG